jgi:hypothetical protein
MAKKFIVKSKDMDIKDDKYVVMSLRIEKSYRSNMISWPGKVEDPETN